MGIQDYLYSEFDSEIVEEFLMMLDAVEDSLDLIIEELYSNYEDAINELFRIFHNLKSATAFLKIHRFNSYTKLVEGILEKARKYKSLPSEDLIDWLFVVANQFHIWYKDINLNIELSPIIPKLLKIPKLKG